MLNKIFYENDNILNNISIHSDSTIYKNSNIELNGNIFSLNYNNKYPSLFDSVIYDSNSYIINSDNIEIKEDQTTYLEFPLYDYYMNIYCNELCTNKYTLKNFNLIIGGKVNTIQHDDSIYINKYKNTVTGNIIYDYIKNTEGNFSYDGYKQDIVEKEEFVGYIDSLFFPQYTLKCTDGTNIKYIKIDLIDLEYSSGILISSTFYDSTKIEYDAIDNSWTNIINLPKLLKSPKFKTLLLDLIDNYDDIKFIFKVKNQNTDSKLKIKNDNFYFNQNMGTKYIFSLDINNISSLVDKKEQFLNRGAFLKYDSASLINLYNVNNNNIKFKINSINFTIKDSYDKSLLESNNYVTYNNYIPLELYTSNNILSIEFNDLVNNHSIELENVLFTLMRQQTLKSINYFYFNTNKLYEIETYNFKYLYSKEFRDIQERLYPSEYFVSKVFNNKKYNILSLLESDIEYLFNIINDQYTINVYYKKVNKFNSLIYIEYSESEIQNYLYKFIHSSEIEAIINNILLSITFYDYKSNKIKVKLIDPSQLKLINKYTDNLKVTYILSIEEIDILEINNIYNKEEINKYYNNKITKDYYMPKDVMYIVNNKK